jgi:hypothetical protein
VLKWKLRDGIEGIIQPEKGSSTYSYDTSQPETSPERQILPVVIHHFGGHDEFMICWKYVDFVFDE